LNLLKRAIASVLSQTYSDIECIVVSDASTDGTVDYCRTLDGIKLIEIPSEESIGGSHARNIGILAAKGEYVALLDDDDCWMPTKIEKQLAMALERRCDLVYCGSRVEQVSKDGQLSYSDRLPGDGGNGNLSSHILSHFVILSSQVLVKRSTFIDVGLFDEKLYFWQDYELSIRMAQVTDFHYVNECLIIYRNNRYDGARLSNQFKPWLKSVNYIRRKHRNLYSALPFRDRLRSIRLYWDDGYYRAKKSLGNHLHRPVLKANVMSSLVVLTPILRQMLNL